MKCFDGSEFMLEIFIFWLTFDYNLSLFFKIFVYEITINSSGKFFSTEFLLKKKLLPT